MSINYLYENSRSGPFILAGPCVIEGRETAMQTAEFLAEVAAKLKLPLIYKSSFDKANRTSVTSFRGPGLESGLNILSEVKEAFGLPIVTDIHHPEQAATVAEVADVIQIPAFLCRQTDLLVAAAQTGKIINIKKGQFLAPWDMKNAVEKVRASGNEQVWLTERGSTYGYNNLVVDMRSIPEMQSFDVPVVFDATHSVQIPGGLGGASGGQREYVPVLAAAAVAAGANGVFMECHPDPDNALCDGPNSQPLKKVEALLTRLKAIWEINNG
ncbi:3-deoxy-8-phosphooctulonate synthase [Pseudodesulfovibrio sp. zrk46]|uniref:3-deoxy-8-phosphooctulonate synthase n=1 Tax=Pseudodesulfovibrio sp. zrk46 TaxID=2725288 RepID=UPI001448BB68|nr:3-deoxy-8-phosphooctulonate synthase [Pseudodesulfovibrio sp. zrk46]QJB57649.1 3-deoxy-8-phosphooctulonate synthase [Pseudodesulfovibrio sp. zrk46]